MIHLVERGAIPRTRGAVCMRDGSVWRPLPRALRVRVVPNLVQALVVNLLQSTFTMVMTLVPSTTLT
jgi:hypothetical protein